MKKHATLAAKRARRPLTILLSVILAIGLMPGIALADGSYQDTDQPVKAPSGGESTVDVGNVTVDNIGGYPAVNAEANPDTDATINVHGGISQTGEDYSRSMTARAYSYGEDKTATVNVEGDVSTEVTASSEASSGNSNGDFPPYKESPSSSERGVSAADNPPEQYLADAVLSEADKPGAQAVVNVGGNVNVTLSGEGKSEHVATGVYQGAGIPGATTGELASSSVNVAGDVTAEVVSHGGEAHGAEIYSGPNGNTVTNIGGGVTAKAPGLHGSATGVNVFADKMQGSSGQATLTVGQGGVTAEAGRYAEGINVLSNRGSTATIFIQGDVISQVKEQDGKAVGIYIAGKADTTEILVEGTVRAKTAGILNRTRSDKLNVTVWKVESDLVGATQNVLKFVDDEATRKAIDYIIKVEQPKEGDILKLAGATLKKIAVGSETRAYDVAKMDQKVYLNANEGWTITAAYNGMGEKMLLNKDENGWFIIVPNGGGVYLSAQVAKQKYDVTFVNDDGAVLQSGKVEYGAMPAYEKGTPTKPPTAQYTYEFAGWEPVLDRVTGAITYRATYTETTREYALTFDLGGGSVDGATGTLTMNAAYGSTVKLPTPTRDGFTFLYWEGSQYAAGASYQVEGAHSFKAVWKKNEPKPDPVKPVVHQASADAGTAVATTPKTGDSTADVVPVALVALAGLTLALAAARRVRNKG